MGEGVNGLKRARREAENHFLRHGHEMGYDNIKAYKKAAKEVIRTPEAVYV